MADIFISYARENRDAVAKLAAALEAAGYLLWWDRHIATGAEYSADIERELDNAKAVLVVWSAASIRSNWVKDEAAIARDTDKLVPVTLDGSEPPLGFRQFHALDFSGWRGQSKAPEIATLLADVATRVGTPVTAPRPTSPRATQVSKSFGAWLAACVGVACIAALVVWGFVWGPWNQRTSNEEQVTGIAVPANSIVVLPFDSSLQGRFDADFGAWLAELVSSHLGKSRELKVISQTSAAALKRKSLSLRDIARRLGVALVLEGSVRSDGSVIMVSAKLINAATDTQLWSELYERRLDNALIVQREVASLVSDAVAVTLRATIAESERQAFNPGTVPEAFDAYLAALRLYRKGGDANVRGALQLLINAVDLDPNFALAWALLSESHSYLYFNQSDATESRRTAAERALGRALSLKPDLAAVIGADAMFQYWVRRDYEGARQRFERQVARWPNSAAAWTALASIARRQGRWGESRIYFDRAIALDPLQASRRLHAATLAVATRDFQGALRQLDAALIDWPKEPESMPFLALKAYVYQVQGRLDEAANILEDFIPQPDGDLVQAIALQALLRRETSATIELVSGLLERDEANGSVGRTSIDLNLYLAELRQLAGDNRGAARNARAALAELQVELVKQPDNADIQSYLALAYSLQGKHTEATRYAALAVSTVPLSKDALSGAYYLLVQSLVWARFGDRDAAVPALAALLKLPSATPLTPALLRLHPAFDKLRGDPRFVALVSTTND